MKKTSQEIINAPPIKYLNQELAIGPWSNSQSTSPLPKTQEQKLPHARQRLQTILPELSLFCALCQLLLDIITNILVG